MRIPENRLYFKKNYHRVSRKRKIVFFLLAFLAVLILSFGIYYLFSVSSRKEKVVVKTIDQLWEEGSYKQVAARCDKKLVDDPLDSMALVYGGFSYFYLGIGQFTMEEKIPLLNNSIVNLRKVLTLNSVPLKGKVDYILGKAYYSKGRYYLDLAVLYLQQSLENGYKSDDTYKYLGLAYSELGLYEKGVSWFLKSLDRGGDEFLYLALGQTYYKMEDDSSAEKYLTKALSSTHDFYIEQKCRFLLGKIYLDKNELDKSMEQYNKILEKNRNSADAYYYLGEIYSKLNKKVKARAEWRKALEIDPSHYGALLRLY